MPYLEELPDQCPPAAARDQELDGVLRFVSEGDVSSITIQDFFSYAALGQTRRNADPCDLASCSLFANEYCEGFKTARKFPKLREKPVARVSIPLGSGKSVMNKKGHIHFWMFNSFDPVRSVLEVIQNDAA